MYLLILSEIIIAILLGFMFYTYIIKYIIITFFIHKHGLNSNEIRKKIYEINGKYYKFIPKMCVCPTFL